MIDSENFKKHLENIKSSNDTVFNFSGTHFTDLDAKELSAIFVALSSLSQTFLLKLNSCEIDEKHKNVLQELTLGLSTTQNMKAFEFFRLSSCSDEVLLKIVESLLRNPGIKSIKLDGVRVTPSHICDRVASHPGVQVVVVDGLIKVDKQPCHSQFFKLVPASNQSLPSESSQEANDRQKRSL